LDGLTTDGSFGAITARNARLNGNLTVAGTIRSLTLGDALDGTIHAGSIASLTATGTFDADVNVSGIAAFRAAALSGGSWGVAGNVGRMTCGSVSGWQATIGGSVASLKVAQDAGMSLTAGSVRTLSIGGDLSDSTLTLNGSAGALDLASLAVRGGIVGTELNSAGNVGTVAAGSLNASRLYAGVVGLPAGQALPDSAADFSAAAIGSLVLRTARGTASDVGSSVAAASVGRVALGGVQTNNGGLAFGVAARQIGTLRAIDLATGKMLKLSKLTAATPLPSILTAQRFNPQDLVIRLV